MYIINNMYLQKIKFIQIHLLNKTCIIHIFYNIFILSTGAITFGKSFVKGIVIDDFIKFLQLQKFQLYVIYSMQKHHVYILYDCIFYYYAILPFCLSQFGPQILPNLIILQPYNFFISLKFFLKKNIDNVDML